MSAAKNSNQQKAPISAAFVEKLRDAFGADQVKVLFVEEGEIRLGSRTDGD